LDRNYPKENRKNITKLDIREKDLESHLDLNSFKNLRELNCSNNKLTKLEVSALNDLQILDCSHNLLTDTQFLHDLTNLKEL
jgi:Leucine-rich repeat (LRR) protein